MLADVLRRGAECKIFTLGCYVPVLTGRRSTGQPQHCDEGHEDAFVEKEIRRNAHDKNTHHIEIFWPKRQNTA